MILFFSLRFSFWFIKQFQNIKLNKKEISQFNEDEMFLFVHIFGFMYRTNVIFYSKLCSYDRDLTNLFILFIPANQVL